MDRKLSVPLTQPPAFLSTISMVVDDRSKIIEGLTGAERKSPSRYAPARELFCSVLQGDFGFDQALVQAKCINDPVERQCAVDVLRASSEFLKSQPPARVVKIPKIETILPNGLVLDVAPIWLRHFSPERLMILHFWEAPLKDRQLSAAAAVIKRTVGSKFPNYANSEIDFISVSLSTSSQERRFQCRDWKALKPLSESDLMRFWKLFCDAWADYKRKPPREIKVRPKPDLFGRF